MLSTTYCSFFLYIQLPKHFIFLLNTCLTEPFSVLCASLIFSHNTVPAHTSKAAKCCQDNPWQAAYCALSGTFCISSQCIPCTIPCATGYYDILWCDLVICPAVIS